MDSPERKPIASGSTTPSSVERTRAHLRQYRRASPPRAIKAEHFSDIASPAKRARPPIEHYDEDIVIKPEEIEEERPEREKRILLIATPGSARKRQKDVKPVIKVSARVKAKRAVENEDEESDSSDLTDVDELEAALEGEITDENEEESDGYVDSEFEELEYEIASPASKKGKGKPKTERENVDYSSLPGLTDVLEANLDLILCGINPGVQSAKAGHPYANPSNSFYRCLHEGGFTEERLRPAQYTELPKLCRIGLTNLTARTTRSAADLSAAEMKECVVPLINKLLLHRPKMICFVGMGICKVVLEHFKNLPVLPTTENPSPKKSKPVATKIKLGLQPIKLTFPPREAGVKLASEERESCWFYCVPSTSGLVSQYQAVDKVILFRELKAQVDRMNAAEEMRNIPSTMVEYRAEEFVSRQALFENS